MSVMSARVVRSVVVAVCVLGIAGMIGGSIAEEQGLALTAGLLSAAAVVCLIVATAVAPPRDGPALTDSIEHQVSALVAAGCDEHAVRRLVAEAAELGRQRHQG
jgi:multisubunit Na+/H+ antiporter MnhB subunit